MVQQLQEEILIIYLEIIMGFAVQRINNFGETSVYSGTLKFFLHFCSFQLLFLFLPSSHHCLSLYKHNKKSPE